MRCNHPIVDREGPPWTEAGPKKRNRAHTRFVGTSCAILPIALLFAASLTVTSGCGSGYPKLVTATPTRVVVAYLPKDGIPRTTRIAQKACKLHGAIPEYISSDDRVVEFKCTPTTVTNSWDPRERSD